MPEQPDHDDDQPAHDYDVFYDAPDDGDTDPSATDPSATGPGATSGADALVAALFEAGPEAAEHLLRAAQELLLAAKAVVDAGERVVEQHRSAAGSGGGAGDAAPDDEPRVRRIDLA
jgi:hypothetical protein